MNLRKTHCFVGDAVRRHFLTILSSYPTVVLDYGVADSISADSSSRTRL